MKAKIGILVLKIVGVVIAVGFLIYYFTPPKSYETIISNKLKQTYGKNWNNEIDTEGLWVDWFILESVALNKEDYQNSTGLFAPDYVSFKEKLVTEGLASMYTNQEDIQKGFDVIENAVYDITYMGIKEKKFHKTMDIMSDYTEMERREILKAMWSSKDYVLQNDIDGRALINQLNTEQKVKCVETLDKILKGCSKSFTVYFSLEKDIKYMGKRYIWQAEEEILQRKDES